MGMALPKAEAPRVPWKEFVRVLALYGLLVLALWLVFSMVDDHRGTRGGWLAIGAIGAYRYGWLIVNLVRSYAYRFWKFPALRKQADALEQPFPEFLHVIIPTYKEKSWVTKAMLKSVTREALGLPSRVHLYITTGGPDEDEVVRQVLDGCVPNPRLTVHMMRQSGKRHGMAYALRAASRVNLGERNSVVVLMDGDTLLGEGAFRRTLPFFALLPKVGGVTTNNVAVTTGPSWYRRWYSLRFSLRNRYMCATSLSGKVLTLTGRYSLIRSEIALSEEFVGRVEKDSIQDFVHGTIQFKTGDDKSTWFTLLKNGWDMLYLPDVDIFCLENAGERPFYESVGKMRRWFGNMLRNNGRAIALGPRTAGLFAWVSLVDQRISMWTSLTLPAAILILAFVESPLVIFYFAIWVVCTRMLYLVALTVEGHVLSAWDLPLLLYQQWVGSFIKIQTLSNLRQQRWGAARADARLEKDWMGPVQLGLWFVAFGLVVAWLVLR